MPSTEVTARGHRRLLFFPRHLHPGRPAVFTWFGSRIAALLIWSPFQFWVALIERYRGAERVVARHVFGPEPNNAELLAWASVSLRDLHFTHHS
jgi:hypothetical protein